MRDSPAIVAFASEATAEAVNIMLGFVPAYVVYLRDTNGTNPNRYEWFNTDDYPSWSADADGDNDTCLLTTGSTGVVTVIDDGIKPYAGAEVVASGTDENFRDREGDIPAVGTVTSQGITIPAAIQTNSGRNVVLAYRSEIIG